MRSDAEYYEQAVAEHVSAEQVLGLLSLWSDEFTELSGTVETGNKGAGALAHLIFEQTSSGDMRRLNFFTRLYQRHRAGQSMAETTVSLVIGKMDS